MGRIVLSYRDYDGEKTTVTFQGSDLTAANIDAEYASAISLQTAFEAVSLGKLQKRTHVAKVSPQGYGHATDEHAQRETKALVTYYDDVTFKVLTQELPCVDLSLQNPDYPGIFYLAGSANNEATWETFVTEFEAYVPGPSGNNAVVEKIIHVGRNL